MQDAKTESYKLEVSEEVAAYPTDWKAVETFEQELESSRKYKEEHLYPHVAAMLKTKKVDGFRGG